MNGAGLLVDAFDRIRQVVHQAAGGLGVEELAERVDAQANSIGWLIWHLSRIQDDHLAGVNGREQVYVAGGWWDRLGRPFAPDDHGYGQTAAQAASFRVPSADALIAYHDAVHEATVAYVGSCTDEDFNRVVDPNWDPPVTLGVRLISVIADDLQHAGQAAFIRGIIERR